VLPSGALSSMRLMQKRPGPFGPGRVGYRG
jgi:hypothetical protein